MLNSGINKLKKLLLLKKAKHDIETAGFWFIDIPRTGSSSLKAELGMIYGAAFGKKDLHADIVQKQFVPSHLTALEVKSFLGEEIFSGIYKFTFVRNPWDRMLSVYKYRLKYENFPKEIDFISYVKQLNSPRYFLNHSVFNSKAFYLGCLDYITNENNIIIIDQVFKFEERDKAIKEISNRLNCDGLGRLKLVEAGSGDNYRKYYDNNTKNIINRVYAEEIEAFQYRF